jgi:hypothetical protein
MAILYTDATDSCLTFSCVLLLQVLSVVAQQLLVLRHARLAAAPRIVFEGRTIFVKDHHVIVTVSCVILYMIILQVCV